MIKHGDKYDNVRNQFYFSEATNASQEKMIR